MIDSDWVQHRNKTNESSPCVLFSTGVPVSSRRFAQATCKKRNRPHTHTTGTVKKQKMLHIPNGDASIHMYIMDLDRVNLRNERRVSSSCVLFSTGVPVSNRRLAQATYGHKERHEVTVRDGYGLGTTVGIGYQSVRLCAVCAYATLLASVSVLCNVEPSKGNVAYR